MYTLVLQSFGRENEYKRAVLTVLSYYSYTSLPHDEVKVILFTDMPEYFKAYFNDLPVEYILLTPEKVKAMRGKIDFLHRMKIAMIEEAFGKLKGNMLYADSDTFFIADPTDMLNKVSEEVSFMHLKEYEFSQLKSLSLWAGKTFSAFADLIELKAFELPGGRTLKVTPAHASWNAGVMFFHPSHARFIPDVYALTDQFYPETGNHASEQYAFSIILSDYTRLSSCDDVIFHYWYSVKKQIVDAFLKKKFSKEWPFMLLDEKLSEVKKWTRMLPDYMQNHTLMLKDNAIQAFNKDCFSEAYKWTFKAVLKSPLGDKRFYKDVMYHTKRKVFSK